MHRAVFQSQPSTATMSLRFPDATASAGGLVCFLVEDSPVIRRNLTATLEEMLDAQVVGSAEDEASAIAWMGGGATRCDIMIIDLFLKSGSGLNVLIKARQMLPGTKLVILSNYATADMRRRCLASGADRVFDKSSEIEEFLAYCESLSDA